MTDPKLPATLQFLVAALRQDKGHSTGRAALFALGMDLDAFDNNIPYIAQETHISEARLREIAAVARQARDENAPTVPDQHLVSQVLMRQFCDATGQGPRMSEYSLQFGLKPKPVSPKSVAKLVNFVEIDSQQTEDLWGKTESNLPGALAAAQTANLFSSPQHVQTIKDAIALHFARSYELLESCKQLWEEGLETARQRFMANPVGLESLFYSRYRLFPPSAAAAREIMAVQMMSRTKELYEKGIVFRLRVVDLFNAARDFAAAAKLQILYPKAGGEFLLGDVPAIPVDITGHKLGVAGGVPFANAATVILPLGPERMAALSNKDEFVELPQTYVDRMNGYQVTKAYRSVFMRQGSGLDVLAQSLRPPAGVPSKPE